jgi:uncharacterized Fe-S cluster-containing radical SAM superfamily protein
MKDKFNCSAPFVAMSFLNTARACCQFNDEWGKGTLTDCQKPLQHFLQNRHKLQNAYISKNKHPGCDVCLKQNSTYADFFNSKWLLDKSNKLSNDLKHLHLSFNNKCNLACRMCSPTFSNLHNKEAGGNGNIMHTIAIDSPLYNDLVQKIEEIEYLYLTGGESFLDPTTWDFLQKCVDKDKAKNITLQVNTNGTVKLDQTQLDILKSFKEIIIHISMDGTGAMAEYTRTGVVWEKWLRNLDRYVENFTQDAITICYTVSALNVWQLDKDEDYFRNQRRFGFHWQTLFSPSGLSLVNLPKKTKQKLIKKYKDTKYKNLLNLIDDIKQVQDADVAKFIDMLDDRALSYGKWPNYIRYSERFPDYWKMIKTS